jgi:4-hydroxybenzoate polyprenyltransferase
MCLAMILVVARAAGQPVSVSAAAFFAAGVTVAYTFDRWADPPGQERPTWCLVVAMIAAMIGFWAALSLPLVKWIAAAILGLLGVSYRGLKRFPLLKNVLVALAWTVAALCFSVAVWPPLKVGAPLGAAIFAVFAAGALLCDFKDVAADTRRGVQTAPVLWGPARAAWVAAGLAALGALAGGMVGRPGLICTGLALAVLAAFPAVISRPVLGPALIDGMLALPAILILTGLT